MCAKGGEGKGCMRKCGRIWNHKEMVALHWADGGDGGSGRVQLAQASREHYAHHHPSSLLAGQ